MTEPPNFRPEPAENIMKHIKPGSYRPDKAVGLLSDTCGLLIRAAHHVLTCLAGDVRVYVCSSAALAAFTH